MFSNAKSNLDLLREELARLRKEFRKAKLQIQALEDEKLPCETLLQQMMIDKLRENWDNLSLEDIETICKI